MDTKLNGFTIGQFFGGKEEKERTFSFYLDLIDGNEQELRNRNARTLPEINTKILKNVEQALGLVCLSEDPGEGEVCFAQSTEVRDDFRAYFTPVHLFQYAYAVMHRSGLRKDYPAILKSDFLLPYPKESDLFWGMRRLGERLLKAHLLKEVGKEITFTHDDNKETITVTKKGFEETTEGQRVKVQINDQAYFEGIPLAAWQFSMGRISPARQWIKVRNGRELDSGDILFYRKMISALAKKIGRASCREGR